MMKQNDTETVTVVRAKSGVTHLPIFKNDVLVGTRCAPEKLSKDAELVDMGSAEARSARCRRCTRDVVWR